MKVILRLGVFLSCLFILNRTALAGEPPPLWFYYSTNLQVEQNVPRLETVFRKAAKAGYSHVLLSDYKFSRLSEVPEAYFSNARKVKAIAHELEIEIVPAIFPIGYSNALLSHDPDLAEALPVRDALFVVRDGVAACENDPQVELKGADFKDFSGWNFHDAQVTENGRGVASVENPKGNARFMQKVKVAPFHQYHISVEIRTNRLVGTPEIKVLDKAGNPLNYAKLGVKPTQDWATHHAVFNSLENDEVSIYFGMWNGESGLLDWRYPKLEEAGLLNLVRRAGAPLEVKLESDNRILEEGKDFEQTNDPHMGINPWKGEYEVWHSPPGIRAKLPDGTRLRVSYYHAITIYDGQVMICPSEPKTLELLQDEARRVHALFGTKSYFMSHDEIRVLGWDKSCNGQPPGAILSRNIAACTSLLRKINPGGKIYVWSDMFDPTHNAHANYYLVRGDLSGSWKGLEQDVVVAAWNYDKRAESLAWFKKLGNPILIAGYYDSDPALVKGWLSAAEATGTKLDGVMYTTWNSNYEDLEAFAEAVRKAIQPPD